MASLKEILVIGGTGAQGIPVVKALAQSGRYSVRVLTRDPESARARDLLALGNVTLFQGQQDSQQDLRKAFQGVYGAWVNLDGFTLGEKNEIFYGIRAYEIARAAGLKHYVWANTEYALKIGDFKDEYHVGHMSAKGRVAEFILAQGQKGMTTSLFTTGPYMDALHGGLFTPIEQEDGSFLFINPGKEGRFPMIALEDVGVYNLWLFDNPSEAAGLDLSVVTEQISFPEVAETFTKVTGKPSTYKSMPTDEYVKMVDPYPNAYINWNLGPDAPKDESTMLWSENFAAFWRYWRSNRTAPRDVKLLDRIHPNRIKSLEEWMRKVNYDGKPRPVLKMVEDFKQKKSTYNLGNSGKEVPNKMVPVLD